MAAKGPSQGVYFQDGVDITSDMVDSRNEGGNQAFFPLLDYQVNGVAFSDDIPGRNDTGYLFNFKTNPFNCSDITGAERYARNASQPYPFEAGVTFNDFFGKGCGTNPPPGPVGGEVGTQIP